MDQERYVDQERHVDQEPAERRAHCLCRSVPVRTPQVLPWARAYVSSAIT